MLIYKRRNNTQLVFETPEGFYKATEEEQHEFRLNHNVVDLELCMPGSIKENKIKLTYKIGFLKNFYQIVFPDWSMAEIYKWINIKWQVFIEQRQMERYVKSYDEMDFEIYVKKEEQ